MYEILSAEQTAKVIGCGSQKVRERVKRGIWTFGRVITASQDEKKQNSYEIYRHKLAEFLGISEEEIEKRLQGAKKNEQSK